MKVKKAVVSVVIGLVIVGAVALALSGWLKGYVYTLIWNEESTLFCGGDFVMTLRDKDITLGEGRVFFAGGDCELRLVNCNIKAPIVVSAGGDARVTIEGGRIEGTEAALDVGGDAVIRIEGAEIIGPVRQHGNAKIIGLDSARAAAPDEQP